MQVAMRALECHVKKAEVKHLMEKYSKDDNNEIGLDEFMQISKCKSQMQNLGAISKSYNLSYFCNQFMFYACVNL